MQQMVQDNRVPETPKTFIDAQGYEVTNTDNKSSGETAKRANGGMSNTMPDNMDQATVSLASFERQQANSLSKEFFKPEERRLLNVVIMGKPNTGKRR